jgi:hypothetical protein
MYEFNSFIGFYSYVGFNKWPAYITVLDSIFDNFNSCGSLIKNFYSHRSTTIYTQPATTQSNAIDDYDTFKRLIKYPYYSWLFNDPTYPMSCTTDPTNTAL